ncbi:TetR/AcrR family transcriptional regulator [Pseudooceanicola sp. C21-150M6]|uniref:TetR/AcrR family transcriptional regulator n=1 Tax=Pseudooceanicola sp. C21-150M6 TaxID=3434355 RepID=UPI003D7FC1AC
MGEVSQKSTRKVRADSIRNRAKLLASATEVFSTGGPEASLEAVARHAGVGIGTLYRHFPTREALFQAVYSHEVDEMVALAQALEAEPDAIVALRRWMHACVRLVATKRGMLAALKPVFDKNGTFFAENSARTLAAVDRIVTRGVSEGRIRDDVGAEEVMRAFFSICYGRDAPDWQVGALQLLDIFVDGLTVRA